MKRMLFIVNAHSGRGDIRHRLLDVIDIFTAAGYAVTCIPTQHTGHATELVRDLGAGFDRIVCGGGDGTVNETLGGLMTLDTRPPLGILPAGTTNDYAYSLSIPSAAVKAAETAANGHAFPIDIGSLNGRFFSYVAAFGLFTDVTYKTDQDAKNLLGGIAYFLEGAKRVSSIKQYHIRVEYDDGVLEDDYIVGLFSNSISIAGVRTAYRNALLDDGMMEICLIRAPKNLLALQDLITVLLDIKQACDLDESDFFTIVHTKKAVVICGEPVAWTVDGESGGTFATAAIETYKQAVTVIAGRDMKENSSLTRNTDKTAGK